MRNLCDLPTDQEEKANEALGALHGLYDLLLLIPRGEMVRVESVSYNLKLAIRACEHAIPNGHPSRWRGCNDAD